MFTVYSDSQIHDTQKSIDVFLAIIWRFVFGGEFSLSSPGLWEAAVSTSHEMNFNVSTTWKLLIITPDY